MSTLKSTVITGKVNGTAKTFILYGHKKHDTAMKYVKSKGIEAPFIVSRNVYATDGTVLKSTSGHFKEIL